VRNKKGKLHGIYKWIWGQEDCNYPDGEGRDISMKLLRELSNPF